MKQFYTVLKSQLDELNRLDANELVKKEYSDEMAAEFEKVCKEYVVAVYRNKFYYDEHGETETDFSYYSDLETESIIICDNSVVGFNHYGGIFPISQIGETYYEDTDDDVYNSYILRRKSDL